MSDLKDPRVLFAAERTLLAWNRTSLGLIAFGFVLERAGLLLNALQQQVGNSIQDKLTSVLGITFIALGGICALISSRQFSIVLNTLTAEEIPKGYKPRWAISINIALAILSVILGITLYGFKT